MQIYSKIKSNLEYYTVLFSSYFLTGVNILVQIFLVPLYIEHLGKYQFGLLMFVLSFINYAALGTGWMAGGMLRILGEYAAREDRDGFARSYILSKIIYVGYACLVSVLMLIAFFGSLWLSTSLPEAYGREILWSIVTASLYFVLMYDFSVERLALIAQKRQTAGNLLQALSLVIFVSCVIPWLLYDGGLEGVFICLIIGILVARVASWLYWKHLKIQLKVKSREHFLSRESRFILRRLLGSTGLGYLIYGILLLTMQADILIIGWLGGASVVTEFVLVWKIAEVLVQLLWKIPEAYQPYLIQMDVRGEYEKLKLAYVEGMRWMTLISLMVGGIYSLFGIWLVRLWVGIENTPDRPIAYVLAGVAIFWLGCSRFPSIFAYSTLKLKKLNIVAGVELLGKTCTVLLLFPYVGYLAPIVAINIIHAGGVAFMYRNLVKP